MAEYTAVAVQTVPINSNVLFVDEAVIGGNCSIVHRNGSGLITLRGLTNQCRARFRVTFNGNIAIPTTGAVGPISIALALNGEAVPSTIAISTPAALNNYNNVSCSIFIDVPAGCCTQVSVKNNSAQAINVQNANLIVERVA